MTQSFVNPFTNQPAAQPPAQPPAPPNAAPPNATSPFAPIAPPATASASPFDQGVFGAPAPAPGKAPRVTDLYDWQTGYGRLVLLAPYRFEIVPNRLGKPGETQERMTADMVVLDGGPLLFGGKPEGRPPVPHNQQVDVPKLFESVYISNVAIVSACRQAYANRISGAGHWMVLGRIFLGPQGDKGNPPWLIGRPDLPRDRQQEGATPEEAALANAFLSTDAAIPMLNRPRGA